jgi:hypothetical protein
MLNNVLQIGRSSGTLQRCPSRNVTYAKKYALRQSSRYVKNFSDSVGFLQRLAKPDKQNLQSIPQLWRQMTARCLENCGPLRLFLVTKPRLECFERPLKYLLQVWIHPI